MFKLIINYYKDLLFINIVASTCLAVITFPGFRYYGFPISFMSGGFVLSLIYFEVMRQKQYYFYFNKALSRTQLYVASFLINTVFGVLILFLMKL